MSELIIFSQRQVLGRCKRLILNEKCLAIITTRGHDGDHQWW